MGYTTSIPNGDRASLAKRKCILDVRTKQKVAIYYHTIAILSEVRPHFDIGLIVRRRS